MVLTWIGRTIWHSKSSAGDDVVEEAATQPNKGMKQTKGGWNWSEAW
jgi:hypothetical protein